MLAHSDLAEHLGAVPAGASRWAEPVCGAGSASPARGPPRTRKSGSGSSRRRHVRSRPLSAPRRAPLRPRARELPGCSYACARLYPPSDTSQAGASRSCRPAAKHDWQRVLKRPFIGCCVISVTAPFPPLPTAGQRRQRCLQQTNAVGIVPASRQPSLAEGSGRREPIGRQRTGSFSDSARLSPACPHW